MVLGIIDYFSWDLRIDERPKTDFWKPPLIKSIKSSINFTCLEVFPVYVNVNLILYHEGKKREDEKKGNFGLIGEINTSKFTKLKLIHRI